MNNKILLEFTSMMRILTQSGLSIRDSLEILSGSDERREDSRVSRELLGQIRRGYSFSASLKTMAGSFPPLYRGMVALGDRVGSVEKIFPHLESYLRDKKRLQDKTISALSYPLLVLAVAILGSLGLLFLLIPQVESMVSSFGGEQAIGLKQNMGNLRRGLGIATGILLLFLASIPLFMKLLREQEDLRLRFDRLMLSLPWIGSFIASWECLNLSFAMEVLCGGGVPMEAALQEVQAIVSNRAYRLSLGRIHEEVRNGIPPSKSFSQISLFPAAIHRWLSIGENSGKADLAFANLRKYFEEEVERFINRLLLLLEPLLISLIGAALIALVMGMVLPLFSMYGGLL